MILLILVLRVFGVNTRTPSTGSDDTQLGRGGDAADTLERQWRRTGETVGLAGETVETLRIDWGIWKIRQAGALGNFSALVLFLASGWHAL